MTSLKGTETPPTTRSDVELPGNAGSLTDREVQGDGAAIVVAGVTTGQGAWESRAQGEGRQVMGYHRQKGPRDA